MNNENNSRALVTGASSGIGRVIAKKLVQDGYFVIACGRRLEKLNELKNEIGKESQNIIPIQVDLKNENDILEMFTKVRKNYGGVDTLINCAGIGYLAPFVSSDSSPWRDTLDINVIALCICTREAIKDMRKRGDRGHIVNLSSIVGHRVGHLPGMYAASKYAITAITESIRVELRAMNSNIRVSQISPGRVETEFGGKYVGDEEKAKTYYSEYKALEAHDIAEIISFMLSRPENVQIDDVFVRPICQP